MAKATEFKKLLHAINLRKPPATFLRIFFGKEKTHDTAKLEVDVKVGKRTMAPFVSPYVGGVAVERDGFSTREIDIPKIAPERITTIEHLEAVGMGQSEYSTKSMAQKQKEIAAADMVDLDEQIIRTEEWMRREVLLKKGVQITGEGVDKFIKFAEDDTITLSGGDLWSDDASDPLAKLEELQRKITKDTGRKPKLLVMDSTAGDAFLTHAKVQAAFDNKRIQLGNLTPSVKNDNVTFLGKITKLGLEIYTYDEWMIDNEGNEVALIPAGHVILGNKDIGVMNYAAVKMIKKGSWISVEAKRVPKHIVDEDNEIEKMRLTSRPLPTPVDTKAWIVMDVL